MPDPVMLRVGLCLAEKNLIIECASISAITDLILMRGYRSHLNVERKYDVSRRPLDVLFNYASVGAS